MSISELQPLTYRRSRSRFRYVLENACLLGLAVVLWGSILAGTALTIAALNTANELEEIFEPTTTGEGFTDVDGFDCGYLTTDDNDLCPQNPRYSQ